MPLAVNSPRRFPAWGAAVLGLLVLTGCPKREPDPPPPPPSVEREIIPPDGGLHFDMRYYDSIDIKPGSARTQRERAIFIQLQRLAMSKPYRNKNGQVVPLPKQPTDSIYEQIGEGNPRRGFANEAEALADIYRQIDSLKVLEHIPLTPH